MVDGVIGDAEPVAQNVGDECTHRFVARPPRKGRDDLGKVLLSPGAFHGSEHLPGGWLHQGFPAPADRLQNLV